MNYLYARTIELVTRVRLFKTFLLITNSINASVALKTVSIDTCLFTIHNGMLLEFDQRAAIHLINGFFFFNSRFVINDF